MSVSALLTPAYPLDWAQLGLSDIPAALDKGLSDSRAAIAQVEELPLDQASYASVITALDRATEGLDFAWGIANHLSGVTDCAEIREIMEKYTPLITELYASVSLSPRIWARVKTVAESSEPLDALQKRYLGKTVIGFKKAGADLPDDKKDELLEIKKKLGALADKFSNTCLDAVAAYEKIITNPDELKGIPETHLAVAAESAKKAGKSGWRFTLQRPSLEAVLTYADSAELRREIWEAYNNICAEGKFDTLPIIRELLENREKLAHLIGYKNFVEYATTERMVKGVQAINTLLDGLFEKTRPVAERDFAELGAFKRDFLGDTTPLRPWDTAYVGEKLQQYKLNFSTEQTRPYFRFEDVRQSLFDLAKTLFNVSVTKVEGHRAWHDEVEYYEMHDDSTGRLIGGFYTDFFPRDSKRAGAWMDALLTGKPTPDGTLSPHIGLICGNFLPPSADKPSLLSHYEVTTIYHEFGHLLHHMLSTVPIPGLCGTNVPWDFVETPSQLLENYCYDRDYLKKLTHHYQTGESLPDDIIAKIKDSQRFLKGLHDNRQLSFGHMDIFIHSVEVEKIADDIEGAVIRENARFDYPYTPPVAIRPTLRNFGHLFGGGYGAGYYSYKNAEVLEADLWSKFEELGIVNPETGARYRDCILSKGNSAEPIELFKAFMGRDVSTQAYFQRLGL